MLAIMSSWWEFATDGNLHHVWSMTFHPWGAPRWLIKFYEAETWLECFGKDVRNVLWWRRTNRRSWKRYKDLDGHVKDHWRFFLTSWSFQQCLISKQKYFKQFFQKPFKPWSQLMFMQFSSQMSVHSPHFRTLNNKRGAFPPAGGRVPCLTPGYSNFRMFEWFINLVSVLRLRRL